jgi:hypothetical protein
MIEDEHARIGQEAKRKADDDARIQANGLKLLDPEQAKTLTREDRLEVYRRSLAAMGIKEGEPIGEETPLPSFPSTTTSLPVSHVISPIAPAASPGIMRSTMRPVYKRTSPDECASELGI